MLELKGEKLLDGVNMVSAMTFLFDNAPGPINFGGPPISLGRQLTQTFADHVAAIAEECARIGLPSPDAWAFQTQLQDMAGIGGKS
jgi:hypothetical protein